jgi:hypothetical protein
MRLTHVPPRGGTRARGAAVSQRDDGLPAASRRAAARLISPLVSLTVSLTLCNFAALAPIQCALSR